MVKDGTNRGGRRVRAGAKPGPLGENSPPDAPPHAWKTRSTNPSTSQTMTLATVRCVPGRRCPNHRTICRRFSVTANRLALTSSIGRRGSGSINVAVPISWRLA